MPPDCRSSSRVSTPAVGRAMFRTVPRILDRFCPVFVLAWISTGNTGPHRARRETMDFVSIRVITGDINRLVGFYEKVTGVQAVWGNEDFAELRTAHGTLAIGSTRTVPLFAPGSARPADNRTAIIEFLVDDVDALYEDLKSVVEDFVNVP